MKRILFGLLSIFVFGGYLNAATLYVASDNVVEITPVSSTTLTTNLTDSLWSVFPQVDAYINIWNDDFGVATTNLRLVAGSEYIFGMDSKFVIIAESVTGNVLFQSNGDGASRFIGQDNNRLILAPEFEIQQILATTSISSITLPFAPKFIEVYAIDDDIAIANKAGDLSDFTEGYIVSKNVQKQLPFVPRAFKIRSLGANTSVNITICR